MRNPFIFFAPPGNGFHATGWWMNNADRVAYLGIMDIIQPREMVYIGINRGLDLVQLLRRYPYLYVTVIDKDLKNVVEEVRHDQRVDLIGGMSEDVLWDVLQAAEPDTIFIDGAHEHPRVDYDIRTSLKMCPKATVVGHDWNFKQVQEAVLSAHNDYPNRKLHIIETAPDHSLGSGPWGGFFIFEPERV